MLNFFEYLSAFIWSFVGFHNSSVTSNLGVLFVVLKFVFLNHRKVDKTLYHIYINQLINDLNISASRDKN